MTEKSRQVRYKRMSSIKLGGVLMRFMGVNEQNQGVHFPQAAKDCPGRLLFLATDVLSATKIMKKNFIRVHARFAKQGVATKVRLVGFKIDGINNSEIIWFYSIQGLFKIAFELGTEAFQRDCLTYLQSEWLQRYRDPPLQPEWVVRYNLRLKMHDMYNNLQSITDTKQETTGVTETSVLDGGNFEPGESDENNSNSFQNNVIEPPLEDDRTILTGDGFLKKLSTFLNSSMHYADTHTQQLISQVIITTHYLENISLQCNETVNKSVFAVFDIMDEYLNLLKSDPVEDGVNCLFGLSEETYTLLYVVGDWLGSQFHQLGDQVSCKVEEFKTQNIHKMDSLPPAEEMIDSLFPQCMKKFVTNWLGEKQVKFGNNQSTFTISTDHDYCPNAKRKRLESEKRQYPLVQLILEFVTNSLISGLTHIVYSKLRYQNNT